MIYRQQGVPQSVWVFSDRYALLYENAMVHQRRGQQANNPASMN
jgi:hypothetical protein